MGGTSAKELLDRNLLKGELQERERVGSRSGFMLGLMGFRAGVLWR